MSPEESNMPGHLPAVNTGTMSSHSAWMHLSRSTVQQQHPLFKQSFHTKKIHSAKKFSIYISTNTPFTKAFSKESLLSFKTTIYDLPDYYCCMESLALIALLLVMITHISHSQSSCAESSSETHFMINCLQFGELIRRRLCQGVINYARL